jgi:hypothetical protein
LEAIAVRSLLHLLSVILVLPSVALTSAFIILGRAIATQSLLGVVGQLLSDAVWLIPWGLLAGFATVLLIAVGGLFVQTRRISGLCVAILGIGSIVIPIALIATHGTITTGQLLFFVPAVTACCIGIWLARFDHRG